MSGEIMLPCVFYSCCIAVKVVSISATGSPDELNNTEQKQSQIVAFFTSVEQFEYLPFKVNTLSEKHD